MRILGIDPGTATTGYGVIETNGQKINLLKFGWISTNKDLERGLRLKSIHQQMLELLKEFSPDVVAIERIFFYNNAKTAMKVSEAMGVLRLAAVKRGVNVFDYAPLKIKAVVANNGRAGKEDMKKVVRKMLGIRAPKKKKTHFDDVADALSVAICHFKVCFPEKGGEKNG